MYVFLSVHSVDQGFCENHFFLSTTDPFRVLETQLRYAHKKTLSLCFNIANPGIATNVVKD